MKRRGTRPAGPVPPASLRTFHAPHGDDAAIIAAHSSWREARKAYRDVYGWPDNALVFLREQVAAHLIAMGLPAHDPYESEARRDRPPLVTFPDGITRTRPTRPQEAPNEHHRNNHP